MIEVMIAMTLTAIAIMGIMALYAANVRASGFTRHQTEAAVLAESKVEELRALPSSPLPLPQTEPTLGPLGPPTTGIFKRISTETVTGANPFADITVTVQWNDNDTGTHSVIVHARRNL